MSLSFFFFSPFSFFFLFSWKRLIYITLSMQHQSKWWAWGGGLLQLLVSAIDGSKGNSLYNPPLKKKKEKGNPDIALISYRWDSVISKERRSHSTSRKAGIVIKHRKINSSSPHRRRSSNPLLPTTLAEKRGTSVHTVRFTYSRTAHMDVLQRKKRKKKKKREAKPVYLLCTYYCLTPVQPPFARYF